MIDHISVGVSNFEASKKFYTQALAPLGYVLMREMSPEQTGGKGVAGFGVPPMPDFWIRGGGANVPSIHIALSAANRSVVDAFYQAALAAGGSDNGAPGLRSHYHPGYYGAFVRDPDGHNIEAVCHKPE